MTMPRLTNLRVFWTFQARVLIICQLCYVGAVAANATSLPQKNGGVAACLPITMPSSDALFSSPRKVFAHYFSMFPLSVDNKPPQQDYYNNQYLNPAGESRKWIMQGGFLRQRPLPLPPNSSVDWRLLNMETEVRLAINRGITGFSIDVLGLKDATDPTGKVQTLLHAAQAVDARFKIMVMPDIAQLKSDSQSVTQIISAVASSPAAFKLPDGRLVVTAFNAGGNPPEWWANVFAQLRSQGINVAFVPTFLGWHGKANAFADLSYGYADWGSATSSGARNMQADPAAAHAMNGKIYMMPVDPQQYRPKSFVFSEASNSDTFRSSWLSAINGGTDWVQLVTWSDFSETSQVEPYTDNTLARNIGTGFYDLNGFYAAWFLSGQQPAISHDVLYYFYRREPSSAASPAQSPTRVGSGVAEDNIELVAFLTEPGTLRISIGAREYQQNVPAGITSFKIPTQPGTPVFSLFRNGASVFSLEGGVQIYGPEGLPSGLADMTYWSGSGARDGACYL